MVNLESNINPILGEKIANNKKKLRGLIFKNNEYKQRIRWKVNGCYNEKQESLHTDSFSTAKIRRDEVISYRKSIISGREPKYTWQKDYPNEPTFCSTYTLESAIEEYLENCKVERISESTITLYEDSLNKLISIVGRKQDVNKITDVHIQTIKKQHHRLTGKPVSGHTINRHIRAIGTMFNWLSKSKHIKGLPECRQIKTPNTLPRYYTDNEFNKVIDGMDMFSKNIYNFYRDTGLRLSEPYKSELAGNYLIIPPSSTKNIIERYYHLTDSQVDVVTSMRHYIKEKLDSKKVKNLKNALQQISRGWSEKVKKIGLSDDKRKFHCLRHTFCVRHYFKCRDLYEVQMLMGHSDIQQTQKYAKLWHNLIGKLEQEFTDLIPENNKSGTEKWDWSGRKQKGYSYLSREMRM